jgi:hypothetical protein
VALLSYFIFVYFHITHQVLGRLPQGVGGFPVLFCFILNYFILVYFYNAHQVLVGLPQRVDGGSVW